MACRWSGVAMTTASMSFCLSNIVRKSSYFFALVYASWTLSPSGGDHRDVERAARRAIADAAEHVAWHDHRGHGEGGGGGGTVAHERAAGDGFGLVSHRSGSCWRGKPKLEGGAQSPQWVLCDARCAVRDALRDIDLMRGTSQVVASGRRRRYPLRQARKAHRAKRIAPTPPTPPRRTPPAGC